VEKDEDKEDIAWEWGEIDKIMSTLSQRKTEEKHSVGDGIEGDPGTEGFDSGFGSVGDQGVREKEKLDAVNTAKKKSRTGDAREGNRAPSLRCCGWHQYNDYILLVLESNFALKQDDIDANVESLEVTVRLTVEDGPKWKCNFEKPINSNQTQIFIKDTKVYIKVYKETAGEEWTQLEANQKQDFESDANSNVDSEFQQKEKKSQSRVYKLDHIKHDWFEKGNNAEEVVVHIYVKNIHKDSVEIVLDGKKVSVSFNTSDPRFLALHEKTTERTRFSWEVIVM